MSFKPITTYTEAINSVTFSKPDKYTVWKPVMVKFNGDFIQTVSDKYIWRKMGDAKLAIRNHIDLQLAYQLDKSISYNTRKQWVSQIMEEWIKAGILEFVEI